MAAKVQFTHADVMIYFLKKAEIRLLVLLLLFISFSVRGQMDDCYEVEVIRSSSFNFIENHVDSLRNRGYLQAAYNQANSNDSNQFNICRGVLYKWGEVSYESTFDKDNVKKLTNKPADFYLLGKNLKKLIKPHQNSGYPFAEANYTIKSIEDQRVNIHISVSKNQFISYDTIVFDSIDKWIHVPYLQHYLGLKVGSPFSVSEVDDIHDNLRQLRFIELVSSPNISFQNEQAIVKLSLERKRVNQFDAILGLIPNASGETDITGQVQLGLYNLFRRGIKWQFYWQKFASNSQELETELFQSKMFKTQLDGIGSLHILRQDSTFLQTSFSLGTGYQLTPRLRVGASFMHQENALLREMQQEEPIQRSTEFSGLKLNSQYGIEQESTGLDNNWFTEVEIIAGQKRIRSDGNLPDEWLNTVPELSNSWQFYLHSSKNIKVGKRSLLHAKVELKGIENQAMGQNEYLRLGGLQNFRGIDRNFLYAKAYGLGTLEYRYFLDNSTSFLALFDGAVWDNQQLQHGFSAGFGLDLYAKNGWFRLIYAVAKLPDQSINLSNAKVHFGYIAVF